MITWNVFTDKISVLTESFRTITPLIELAVEARTLVPALS